MTTSKLHALRTAGLVAIGITFLHSSYAEAAKVEDFQDVDNPARHFIQTGTTTLTNAFNPSGVGQTVFTVPAGKVLVIEYFSSFCQGSNGVTPNVMRLGTDVDHFFPFTITGMAGVQSNLTRVYAAAGTNVNLTVFPTTNAPNITCDASLSGYMLDQ
jgi:hypothetical protein